jgi:hypothetical protein
MPFTVEEKLKEVERELEQRHRVYRWQVRNGRMKAEVATRQIAIMTEIKLDYLNRAKEGPLFASHGESDAV